MKTTRITGTRADAPVRGAEKVEWFIGGEWVHVGWLMPQLPWPQESRDGQ